MNSGPGDKRSGISPPRGSPRIVKNGVSGGMGHFLIPNSSSSSSSNEIGDGKTIRSTAAISHRNSVIGIIRWSKPWGRNKQERGIFSCVQPKKKKKNSFLSSSTKGREKIHFRSSRGSRGNAKSILSPKRFRHLALLQRLYHS